MTENSNDAVSDAVRFNTYIHFSIHTDESAKHRTYVQLSQLSHVGTLSKKVYVPSVSKKSVKKSQTKKTKKKKKMTAPSQKYKNDRTVLVDDLFAGLDDSMKVKETPATKKTLIHLTKEARKQREIEVNAPVLLPVATADGVFTKGGMERLVMEAKRRKQKQAQIAREKMRKKKEEEEKAAELERIRLEKEKNERIERLKVEAEKREKHRSSRVLTIDEETKESNLEAQEDELEALESMYPDEYVAIDKSTFKIVLENMTLKIQMPDTYPSNSPPVSTFEGKSVDEEIIHLLEDMWMERDGCVVIFEWLEELKERLGISS